MRKILIINNDFFGDRIAGTSIRSYEIARELAGRFRVTLANPNKYNVKHPNKFNIVSYDKKDASGIKDLIRRHDIIISQGTFAMHHPEILAVNKIMIFDLYCLFFIENLERHKNDPKEYSEGTEDNKKYIDRVIARGDYFICANEKQRAFWIALLYNKNRITRDIYLASRSLQNLLAVVPFGIPTPYLTRKRRTKSTLRRHFDNVKDNDLIVTWFGGVWEWFDPRTPIKAIYNIAKKNDRVKLFFIGGKHPNEQQNSNLLDAIQYSKKLGLYNKSVFFIDWVPYESRGDYLAESDVGIIIHRNNLETFFAWRTRVLDYLWAGLPTIITEGDPLGDEIRANGLGITTNYNDPKDVEKAIMSMLNKSKRKEYQKNIVSYRGKYKWENVIKPLRRFCLNPSSTSNHPTSLKKKEGSLLTKFLSKFRLFGLTFLLGRLMVRFL